jgi:ribonuclease P protein component
MTPHLLNGDGDIRRRCGVTPDESFPKRERILKTGDFRKAYKEGAFTKAGPFVLHWRRNDLAHARLGLSVSAGRVKLAVRRNRIKRFFRESYRRNKRYIKKGFDMVISAKKEPPAKISYREIEAAFLKLMKNSGLSE